MKFFHTLPLMSTFLFECLSRHNSTLWILSLCNIIDHSTFNEIPQSLVREKRRIFCNKFLRNITFSDPVFDDSFSFIVKIARWGAVHHFKELQNEYIVIIYCNSCLSQNNFLISNFNSAELWIFVVCLDFWNIRHLRRKTCLLQCSNSGVKPDSLSFFG